MSEKPELTVATSSNSTQSELSDEQDGLVKPIFVSACKLFPKLVWLESGTKSGDSLRQDLQARGRR